MLLLHARSRPRRVKALQAFLQGLTTRDVQIGDWKTFASFQEAQGF